MAKKAPMFTTIRSYLRDRSQQAWQATGEWVSGTAERLLNRAYEATLRIQSLEAEHFDGEQIAPTSAAVGRYSDSSLSYFQTELQRELDIAKRNLTAFKLSNRIISSSSVGAAQPSNNSLAQYSSQYNERSALILEKLQAIDTTLNRYANVPELTNPRFRAVASQAVVPVNTAQGRSLATAPNDFPNARRPSSSNESLISDVESISDKTGIFPRSILGTVSRIAKELSPQAEEELVRDFRSSKKETILALRFVLLLMLIPLLAQQLTKNFVVGPIVDHFRQGEAIEIFLHREMEEEAFRELNLFREHLEFENLIHLAPKLSPEDMELKLEEKANEIAFIYQIRSANAIKNVFADLFGLGAFTVVVAMNKRAIAVFQSFFGRIVYGLSDSAKAFILILFTDVFVGFHSPHGWEVLLEGACRHLGLPANRDFIFIFIATFPVILDTIFKYWIFRYLNRISPSAVATYKNMNE